MTTSPAARFDRTAAELSLVTSTITGGAHTLRTYASPHLADASSANQPRRLHVYFDGDGRPFVGRTRPAIDPTPQEPLTLRMLAADPDAVYLGRPCYHGVERNCDARAWTVGRYGEAVVSSMAAGVAALADVRGAKRVLLIGYSGGGVLAMLVAERLTVVEAVITVAANLDTAAWTRHHAYTPLRDSLNPATRPVARAFPQLHYAGAEDANVPPALQAGFARMTPTASIPGGTTPRTEFRVIEGFGHTCCWAESWPTRLAEIEAFLAERPARD
jgi:hypothetical protein